MGVKLTYLNNEIIKTHSTVVFSKFYTTRFFRQFVALKKISQTVNIFMHPWCSMCNTVQQRSVQYVQYSVVEGSVVCAIQCSRGQCSMCSTVQQRAVQYVQYSVVEGSVVCAVQCSTVQCSMCNTVQQMAVQEHTVRSYQLSGTHHYIKSCHQIQHFLFRPGDFKEVQLGTVIQPYSGLKGQFRITIYIVLTDF